MSDSKEEMLAAIRKAILDVPESEKPNDIEVARTYRQNGDLSRNETVNLFMERVGEYNATVKRVTEKELTQIIDEICHREKVKNLVIPEGFIKEILPETVSLLFDFSDNPLSNQKLDESDGVITTCACAIAQTGTIILNAGSGQGRRVLTLVPDFHLCLVHEDQIVELVAEGFAVIEQSVNKERRPITFISGPSATSDIELSRVEGVHGPRRLDVIIYA